MRVSLAHGLPSPASRVLVVVPTYQEAQSIETLLWRVRRAVPDATVLVVDDGSPDGTADIAEATGAEVMRRPAKGGLGAAYRTGFAWGLDHGFDVLVEIDADLSHDPAALPSLLAAVDEGAGLAIGSRYVAGGEIPAWPLRRRLLSRWGNRYAGAMLRLPVRDATAGFRAYRADVLRTIDVETVRADGYGFQIEMAYRVVQAGGSIAEVPITFRDRTRGTSKMSGRIILEAMALVTRWGLRDRYVRIWTAWRRRDPHRSRTA
jgi:glycosyltransferase involved in cell wall biosynthesis